MHKNFTLLLSVVAAATIVACAIDTDDSKNPQQAYQYDPNLSTAANAQVEIKFYAQQRKELNNQLKELKERLSKASDAAKTTIEKQIEPLKKQADDLAAKQKTAEGKLDTAILTLADNGKAKAKDAVAPQGEKAWGENYDPNWPAYSNWNMPKAHGLYQLAANEDNIYIAFAGNVANKGTGKPVTGDVPGAILRLQKTAFKTANASSIAIEDNIKLPFQAHALTLAKQDLNGNIAKVNGKEIVIASHTRARGITIAIPKQAGGWNIFTAKPNDTLVYTDEKGKDIEVSFRGRYIDALYDKDSHKLAIYRSGYGNGLNVIAKFEAEIKDDQVVDLQVAKDFDVKPFAGPSYPVVLTEDGVITGNTDIYAVNTDDGKLTKKYQLPAKSLFNIYNQVSANRLLAVDDNGADNNLYFIEKSDGKITALNSNTKLADGTTAGGSTLEATYQGDHGFTFVTAGFSGKQPNIGVIASKEPAVIAKIKFADYGSPQSITAVTKIVSKDGLPTETYHLLAPVNFVSEAIAAKDVAQLFADVSIDTQAIENDPSAIKQAGNCIINFYNVSSDQGKLTFEPFNKDGDASKAKAGEACQFYD